MVGGVSEAAESRFASLLPVIALLSVFALVVSVLAAGWFGFGWARAAVTEVPRAHAREEALDAARQAVINMSSMNPDDVAGSLSRMQESATGKLLDDFTLQRKDVEDRAVRYKIRRSATVIAAALTELSSERDSATAVVMTMQSSSATTDVAKVTVSVRLRRADGAWRAESMLPEGDPVKVDDGPAARPPAR